MSNLAIIQTLHSSVPEWGQSRGGETPHPAPASLRAILPRSFPRRRTPCATAEQPKTRPPTRPKPPTRQKRSWGQCGACGHPPPLPPVVGDCPTTAAPLRRRWRLDPLRPAASGGGRRAPRTATEQDRGCGHPLTRVLRSGDPLPPRFARCLGAALSRPRRRNGRPRRPPAGAIQQPRDRGPYPSNPPTKTGGPTPPTSNPRGPYPGKGQGMREVSLRIGGPTPKTQEGGGPYPRSGIAARFRRPISERGALPPPGRRPRGPYPSPIRPRPPTRSQTAHIAAPSQSLPPRPEARREWEQPRAIAAASGPPSLASQNADSPPAPAPAAPTLRLPFRAYGPIRGAPCRGSRFPLAVSHTLPSAGFALAPTGSPPSVKGTVRETPSGGNFSTETWPQTGMLFAFGLIAYQIPVWFPPYGSPAQGRSALSTPWPRSPLKGLWPPAVRAGCSPQPSSAALALGLPALGERPSASGPGPCRGRLVALRTSPPAAPLTRDRCRPHPLAPYGTEPSGDSWLPSPPGRCSSVCGHYPAPGAPMAGRRGLSRQLGPPFGAPTAGEAPLRALLPLAVGDSLTP